MDSLRSPWHFLAVILADAFAIAIVNETVENDTIRDIAIVVLALAGVVGIVFLLARFSPGGISMVPTSRPRRRRIKRATGESTLKDVRSIDFSEIPAVWLPNYLELKLGEIALLRRIAVAQHPFPGLGNMPPAVQQARCEGVLKASGINDPAQSIVRLEARSLISKPFATDFYGLTEEGEVAVEGFTELLKYDLSFAIAYMNVRREVDRTIRLDGKPLHRHGLH